MFTARLLDTHLLIEFHAPDSSNALSIEGARELAAVQRAHRLTARPVVVRSLHPRVFCSGGNLSDHLNLRGKLAGLRANREIARHLDAFARWPVPKLAVVEGDALGGGVEWLARFDFRWVSPAAQLTFWQKRVGLTPGWGGGRAWSHLVGEAQTRRLLLEARPLSSFEALRLRLVDRVVSASALETEIDAWARAIASPLNADLAVWSARGEAKTFAKLWWGPLHRAALNAWRSR